MAKNYTWHLTCETHDIDEWASCQTTGNDEIVSQRFIEEYAQQIKGKYACGRTIENLVELVEEIEVN